MKNIIELILSIANKKLGLISLALLLMSFFNAFEIYSLKSSVDISMEKIEVTYAFEIIKFEMQEINSYDDIVLKIREWEENGWNAQLAALSLVCNKKRDLIEDLTGLQVAQRMCSRI